MDSSVEQALEPYLELFSPLKSLNHLVISGALMNLDSGVSSTWYFILRSKLNIYINNRLIFLVNFLIRDPYYVSL